MQSIRSFATALGLVLVPVCAVSAQDSQPQKHTLRYALQEGTVLHYVLSSVEKAQVNMSGQPMDTERTLEMFVTVEVTEVADGVAKLASKLDRIVMEMTNPMMNISMDTDDEDNVPAMLDPVLDMIDETVTSDVDDRGQHSNVVVPAAFSNPRTAGIGLEPHRMLEQFWITFPEEPVAVGESWVSSFTKSQGQSGNLTMTVTNTLEDFANGVATLTQAVDIELDGEGTPMTLKGEVESSHGKAVVDVTRILAREGLQEVVMDVAMEHPQMKMEMAITSTASLRPYDPDAKAEEAKAEKDDDKE